ncbi:hypothetical protein LJM61_004551, partial [Salmonella enterica]|nr:hypothetical protein [Salmonella enterica]
MDLKKTPSFKLNKISIILLSVMWVTNSNASGYEVNGLATGTGSPIAIGGPGNMAKASGGYSTSVGANSSAEGSVSSAFGDNAHAKGAQSTAIGHNAKSSGENSTSIGVWSTASGADTSAMGNKAKASGLKSTALGAESKATANGSVAIGSSSVANEENTVSFGSDSHTRKLVNVSQGIVAGDSTEAVNGAQLFAANGTVASALGTSVDEAGNIVAPVYKVDGREVNSVGDALTSIDDRTTKNTSSITTLAGDISSGKAGLVQLDEKGDAVFSDSLAADGAFNAGNRTVT